MIGHDILILPLHLKKLEKNNTKQENTKPKVSIGKEITKIIAKINKM